MQENFKVNLDKSKQQSSRVVSFDALKHSIWTEERFYNRKLNRARKAGIIDIEYQEAAFLCRLSDLFTMHVKDTEKIITCKVGSKVTGKLEISRLYVYNKVSRVVMFRSYGNESKNLPANIDHVMAYSPTGSTAFLNYLKKEIIYAKKCNEDISKVLREIDESLSF